MLNRLKFAILCLLAVPACGQNRFEEPAAEYTREIDTRNKTIELQAKRQYRFAQKGLSVDNLFPGARLSGVSLAGSTLKLNIAPENVPVNASSWYAFRIVSAKRQSLTIELNYDYATHRYQPRLSTNGRDWFLIDLKKIKRNKDGSRVWFSLQLPADTVWIAAQEIVSSTDVANWSKELSASPFVHRRVIGQSVLGNDIPCLDMYAGKRAGKPIIVILGRQHPPEVTGHFALQAFVERLLKHEDAAGFFARYRVIVLPLINPDGVDLGHWRHNANGIDLNRDYAAYEQPETKAVTSFLVNTAKENEATVLMGLDFHSTYRDIYYTNLETSGVALAPLKDDWLNAIRNGLKAYNYKLNEEPHSVTGNPSAQHWFYHQFKALGITYEVGDNTSREFIKTHAKVSADALVALLHGRYYHDSLSK